MAQDIHSASEMDGDRLVQHLRDLPHQDEATRLQTADDLILAFGGSLPGGLDAPTQAVADELQATHRSLEAVSQGDFDEARSRLRAVSRRSPWSHWKWFLKGMIAFYSGDHSTAIRCFDEMPEASVLHRACLSFRLAMGRLSPSQLDRSEADQAIAGLGHLLGRSDSVSSLKTAHRYWAKRQFVKSYETLHREWAAFPTHDTGLSGLLSEFYFKALFLLPREAQWELFEHFATKLRSKRFKNSWEQQWLRRTLCLTPESLPVEILKEYWSAFIEKAQQALGPSPELEASAYLWLGRALSRPEFPNAQFADFHISERLRDVQGAVEAFRQSIEADPSFLQPHLALLELYESLDQARPRNRLLDEMVSKFPQEKEVLLKAGRNCVQRKAYIKAIGYLERALELDRVDPQIPQSLAEARIGLGIQHYRKGRLAKARAAFEALEPLTIGTTTDFRRSQPHIQARVAALEALYGESEASEAALEKARQSTDLPAEVLLSAHFAYRSYCGVGGEQTPFGRKFKKHLKSAQHIQELTRLFMLYDFWLPGLKRGILPSESEWLETFGRKALRGAGSADDLATLAEWVPPDHPLEDEVESAIDRMLKKEPHHPKLRFYVLIKEVYSVYFFGPSPRTIEELRSIIQEAKRRGDTVTEQRANQLLKSFEESETWNPSSSPSGEPPSSEAPDEEELDKAREAFHQAWEPGMLDEFLEYPLVQDLLGKLIELSDSEMEAFRRECAHEIPSALLDELFQLARYHRDNIALGTAAKKEKPSPPKPRSTKKRQNKGGPQTNELPFGF